MGGLSISRNARCPCGSGRKYKRCCLADEEQAVREARFDDAVGRRIQDWSADQFDDEIGSALEEFVGPERVMDDDDIQIFATWFHNDRELAGGGTPAERYAARSDLAAPERDAASQIAAAWLGLYRVVAVEPGRSLTLEHLLDGTRVEARSPHVSREAIRWDILLARVMDGDPPSLWGPTRFFEPCEEPELRAELARLAGSPLGDLDEQALACAFRRHALELMRFLPPSRSAEPSFFTLEGDPVVFGSAIWVVHDVAAVAERIRELAGLLPGDPLELDITASRASLVLQRPPLPPGALALESSAVDALDTIPIATLRLEGGELHSEAMSEQRLAQTIEIVAADFGELVQLRSRDVMSVDEALAARGANRRDSAAHRVDAVERGLVGDLVTERMRRWLDEPHPLLDGRTPREAVAGAGRAEVVQLLRQIENGAERARRRGEPAADVARLRDELGLNDELAA
jgi:SEC-C motif-containing protein/antitoxin Xre/MbcA/ParS-like protein